MNNTIFVKNFDQAQAVGGGTPTLPCGRGGAMPGGCRGAMSVALALGLISAVAWAKPEVTNVTIANSASSGAIEVSYALSEPAVVLVDILTNGVSVGNEALLNMKGDAGHLVAAGNRKAIWVQRKSTLPKMNDPSAAVTAKVEAWSRYSPPDYLVVDLTKSSNFTYYASADRIPGGVASAENKTKKMIFRKIPAAGETMMLGSGKREVPTWCHTVTNDYVGRTESVVVCCDQVAHPMGFTNDYYLAIYECTQAQWLQIFGNEKDPWHDTGCHFTDCADSDWRPATGRRYAGLRGQVKYGQEAVSHWPENGHRVKDGSEVDDFRKRTGLLFDLPTEAQWEFAARAGVTTIMPNGQAFISMANVTNYAWCSDNYLDDPAVTDSANPYQNQNQTHAVGKKLPNAWGLYDMLGNSSECCLDGMDSDSKALDPLKGAYSIEYPGPVLAPSESTAGVPRRVRRGGCYLDAYDRMLFSRRAGMSQSYGSADAAYRAWLPAESPAWQIGE